MHNHYSWNSFFWIKIKRIASLRIATYGINHKLCLINIVWLFLLKVPCLFWEVLQWGCSSKLLWLKKYEIPRNILSFPNLTLHPLNFITPVFSNFKYLEQWYNNFYQTHYWLRWIHIILYLSPNKFWVTVRSSCL